MNTATAAKAESATDPVKANQQAAWAAGDYSVVGTTLQIVGESLAEALDLRCNNSVLDVAAGNGNFSLAAARRGTRVTSTDYVPALLARGAERATAERLQVTFEFADAEQLPYDDHSFDVVGSTFGVMFTPNQRAAASEMKRVCRPQGRVGLANWTATGFIGSLFPEIGAFVPPAKGIASPALWGDVDHVAELFGCAPTSLNAHKQQFTFRYPSTQAWLTHFIDVYGPVQKAFEKVSPELRGSLHNALIALAEQFNRADDGTMVVPSEYLEVTLSPHNG